LIVGIGAGGIDVLIAGGIFISVRLMQWSVRASHAIGTRAFS
jgi:hypothetical protein